MAFLRRLCAQPSAEDARNTNSHVDCYQQWDHKEGNIAVEKKRPLIGGDRHSVRSNGIRRCQWSRQDICKTCEGGSGGGSTVYQEQDVDRLRICRKVTFVYTVCLDPHTFEQTSHAQNESRKLKETTRVLDGNHLTYRRNSHF